MIPAFDHNNVIPPHLGSPYLSEHLSPYSCSTLDLCHHFATSQQRVDILKGFLAFRRRAYEYGILSGFQWLDGSFIENIELTENRAPRDIDVVTFYRGLEPNIVQAILDGFTEFVNPPLAKENYNVDHYHVDYAYTPEATMEATRYWIQLFTHNRLGVWKGILRLELNTPDIDAESLEYLNVNWP